MSGEYEKRGTWSGSSALAASDSCFDEFMRNMSKPLHNTSSVFVRVMGSLKTVDAEAKLESLVAVMGVWVLLDES